LSDAADALALSVLKDLAGGKVMMKMTKPRKPRKAEREAWAKLHGSKPHPVLYWESPELFETLFAYCRQDVLAEEAISKRLDDLSPAETEVYLLDQTINERGFQLDVDAIGAAERLIARETTRLNAELATLTEGSVAKATQRAQMLKWFASQGLNLADTQKETIDECLDNNAGISARAVEGLRLVRTLGRSSTAKYRKMADWACPDGRVRGGLLYHGASTGRWSGAGVQPHNFPRGAPGGPGKDQDALWDNLKAGRLSAYPDVMEALSEALRGAIMASPGKQLYVADYASIEARVLLWLADDTKALGIFTRGEDIYCDMASEIYGRPITKADKDERQLGKTAILGLGYQMGASKFVDTAMDMAGIKIDEDMAKRVVDAYRSKFWKVKQLWDEQQATAIEACYVPQETVTTKYVNWLYDDDEGFLFCTLPSGRRLAYPEPEVHMKMTPWGEKRPSLTFMGIDGYSRKWTRQHTYGGSIVENEVQAIARDLMAAAMLRCEQSGIYEVVLTVHDEIVAEADLGVGSVRAFEELLTELPPWAMGCPIAAEGWRGLRYHK
jgi:DNA polymerase